METYGQSSISESEALLIKAEDEQFLPDEPASAHTIGHDTWQQVGFLLTTSFNSGGILCTPALILVPLSWPCGIPILVGIAIFSAYTNWLLAGFHYIEGQRFIRYRDMMGYLFGKKVFYATWMFQFLNLVLTNMAFIVLGSKALKDVSLAFSESTLRLQYFIIITGVAYFMFALAVPNMSAMRIWLGASAILTFCYIGVLFGAVTVDGTSNYQRNYEIRGNTVDKVFNAFGAISAIILCNNSGMLPEIQSTVQRPAVKNMRNALYVQYTAGILLYHGVTILGYWAYGSEVSDYLPKELRAPKWKVLINSAVFLQSIISQHMFIQPIHETLDTKFLILDKAAYTGENFKRRFLLRALLFAANTFVAAAIPFMGDFISLLGSFTLIPLTFVFPSMIFIKVKGKTARIEQNAWHWVIICVFSVLAVATTLSALRSIFNNVKFYHLFSDQ